MSVLSPEWMSTKIPGLLAAFGDSAKPLRSQEAQYRPDDRGCVGPPSRSSTLMENQKFLEFSIFE
eukprot:4377902-Pyramimonas_sp.AAC.1